MYIIFNNLYISQVPSSAGGHIYCAGSQVTNIFLDTQIFHTIFYIYLTKQIYLINNGQILVSFKLIQTLDRCSCVKACKWNGERELPLLSE